MARQSRFVVCALALALLCAASPTLAQETQPQGAACPLDPTTTTLDFTEVKTACVAPAAGSPPPSEFCDSCSCALFTAFTPALAASGVFSAGRTQDSVNQGVAVITSCIQSFLAQFVSAQVDVPALVALGDCKYGDDQVPACLVERVTALAATANTTEPPVVASQGPAVPAAGVTPVSDGLADKQLQDTINAQKEIKDAINNAGQQQPAATGADPEQDGAPDGDEPAPAVAQPQPEPASSPEPAAAAPAETTPAPAPAAAPQPASSSSLRVHHALPATVAGAALLIAALF